MKIKHWQGYGSVSAKLITKTPNEIVIEVTGEHEYGLATDDGYTAKIWLLDKFLKGNGLRAYDVLVHCNEERFNKAVYYFSPKFGLTFKQLEKAS